MDVYLFMINAGTLQLATSEETILINIQDLIARQVLFSLAEPTPLLGPIHLPSSVSEFKDE